jgi:hypothetical protein
MGTTNTPPIAWTKIIYFILLIKYLHEGITFLLGFLRLCNTLLGFFKYVMEPKGFLIYPNRGIACALSNFGHKQYPSNTLDQNNSIHDVYRIPS